MSRPRGLKVRTKMDGAVVAGFNTAGLQGKYQEAEALQMLLAGTGLEPRLENASTFSIGLQAKEDVTVTAAASVPAEPVYGER